MAIGRWFE
jgi:hypothetical protein